MFNMNNRKNHFTAPSVEFGLSGLNICVKFIPKLHMRSFKTASSHPDFIEVKKEVAYLRSMGENPCNVTPDNMGLHNQNTQVSKIRKMEVLIGA